MKQFKLNVTIEGPFVSSASTISEFGVDNPALRNHEGIPIILGTQIIGKLRHFGSKNLEKILGEEGKNPQSDAEKEWKSKRSEIFISDLTMEQNKENLSRITRIQIDTGTQTVKQGALQVIETVLAPRETAVFSGDVIFFNDNDSVLENDIKQALLDSYQIGAFRSIGYGKIADVKINKITLPNNQDCSCIEDTSRFTLSFKDIFCIAKPQKGTEGNVFESEEIISGGVIKGAIANMLLEEKHKALKDNLHLVHISHAKSSDKNHITRYRTQSVTATVNTKGNVVFWEDDPNDPEIKLKDKHLKIIRDYYNIPHTSRTMRVRSAIDENKRRSKDEALFAYEAIVPFDHLWVFDVNFNKVPQEQREAVKKQFSDCLKHGLYRIGKTDARADVGYVGKVPETETHYCGKALRITEFELGKSYKIILETDAEILGTHSDLNEATSLKKAYETYFEKKNLKLEDYYTEEAFAGGDYLKNIFKITPYQPKILTKAGSVFIVSVTNQEGVEILKEWQQYGLDNRFSCWQQSPYVKNNGYGEIRVERVA